MSPVDAGVRPVRGTVTAWSACGPRPYQEDRFVAEFVDLGTVRGHLLAVLDGHGGEAAAEACARSMSRALRAAGGADAEGALRAAVEDLVRLTEGFDAGTTLAAALVQESVARVAVAVLGDSAVVAVDSRGRAEVSPEHNARTNAAEREAAVRRGGVWEESGYLRNPGSGYGVQLTRALGDAGMGPVLSRIPEVYSVDLGPDSVVVLATDGVFDPSHAGSGNVAEQILRLRGPQCSLDARQIVEWAARRGLQDNATAVVWESRPPGVPATAR